MVRHTLLIRKAQTRRAANQTSAKGQPALSIDSGSISKSTTESIMPADRPINTAEIRFPLILIKNTA